MQLLAKFLKIFCTWGSEPPKIFEKRYKNPQWAFSKINFASVIKRVFEKNLSWYQKIRFAFSY